MYELKPYRGVACHDSEEWYKKRNWLVVLKLTWGIWQILTRALKSLKNCVLMGSLWTKYIMFELKMYRGVIFHETIEWCKIWRKTDL